MRSINFSWPQYEKLANLMQLVAKCFKYLNRVDNANNYPVALRQAEAGQRGVVLRLAARVLGSLEDQHITE